MQFHGWLTRYIYTDYSTESSPRVQGLYSHVRPSALGKTHANAFCSVGHYFSNLFNISIFHSITKLRLFYSHRQYFSRPIKNEIFLYLHYVKFLHHGSDMYVLNTLWNKTYVSRTQYRTCRVLFWTRLSFDGLKYNNNRLNSTTFCQFMIKKMKFVIL